MSRPLRIVGYLAALLAVIVALAGRYPPASASDDPEPKAVGVPEMEEALAALRVALAAQPDTVLMLGDSSLIEHEVLAPDQTLRNMIETGGPAAGFQVRVLARRGFDGVAYYSLADPLVGIHPRAVVLLANLQAFADSWFRNARIKHPDLVAFLALWRVPQALLLPLDRAGIADSTIASLPVLHLVGMTHVPEALRDWRDHFRTSILDGVGPSPAAAAPPAIPLPPGAGPAATAPAVGAPSSASAPVVLARRQAPMGGVPGGRGQRRAPMYRPGLWTISPFAHTEFYPDHLQPDAPAVEVFAAAVRRLTGAGVPTIVLIAPVHLQALRMTTAYTRRDIDGAIRVVREMSEQNGARVLDLTQVVTEERYFTDAYTHLTAEGNRIAADAFLRDLPGVLAPVPGR